MIELEANVARFYFEAAHLAPETFQVASFSGTEGISKPYRFDLNLVSQDPFVDFSEVVNQQATFIMMRGGEAVPVHGIIAHFEQAGRIANHVAYRATLVPRLWWLSLTYQSRIFQDVTVIEIVQDVLDKAAPASIPYRFDLVSEAVYRRRAYCVQYCETDLDFISRLLEFEGISYFFEPFGESERIVFTDRQGAFRPIEGQHEISYHQGAGLVADKTVLDKVDELICCERVVTGRVLLKDRNHETPHVDLQAESQLNGTMPGTRYEYGAHFEDVDQGAWLAKIRNEEIEAQRRVLKGKSGCMGFRSGHHFTLTRHYRPDLNDDYLLTQVKHTGSQKEAMGLLDAVGGDGQHTGVLYQNTFTCIPARVLYRPPRRTPTPQVPGVMTARMEARDPEDQYAFLDEEGRYRARMDFDLRDTDEAPPAEASKPIRMNQPYSGKNYGVHFPNHEGTEMVWSCINGDPDRPMALGTAPHADTSSPSTVVNEAQSVIRTAGGNELTFDDTADAENIYMHATKNHTVKVRNSERISVGADQSLTVGHDRKKTVGNDETNYIQKNRITEVYEGDDILNVHEGYLGAFVHQGDYYLSVQQGAREVAIHRDDTLQIAAGDRTVRIVEGDDTLHIETGHRTVHLVGGNDESNILTGNRTVRLSTGDDTLVAAAGGIDRLAPAGTYRVQALQGVVECVESIKFTCGASTIELTPAEIRINGPLVKINCS